MSRWVNLSFCKKEEPEQNLCIMKWIVWTALSIVLLRFHVILIKTLCSIPCSADTMLLQGVFFGTLRVSLQCNKTLPPADSLCLFCIKSHSNPVTISTSPLEKGSAEMAAVFWVAAEKNLAACLCLTIFLSILQSFIPFKGSLKKPRIEWSRVSPHQAATLVQTMHRMSTS